MDVAPDAEARVGGGERVVERPGDGPPRAGDLAAGGKAAEDVGRDGDRTAREFGGLRGARRDIEARGVQRDDGRREEGMWMSARRTGPSARGPPGENDPGGRNDRLGSRAGARRGGGGARGCGGRASRRCVRRAHPVLAAAVSAVALELHVRLERLEDRAPVSDFHHELVLVRDDVPQARDDAVRPRAPGTTRVGPHRAATPEPEATRGVRDPGGRRVGRRRCQESAVYRTGATILRQRHILPRVSRTCRGQNKMFGWENDRRARRGSAECLSMVSQGVSARTRAPVPEPTRPRPASATPPRPPLHLSVLSPRPQPDGVSRLLVGALAIASAARDPSRKRNPPGREPSSYRFTKPPV